MKMTPEFPWPIQKQIGNLRAIGRAQGEEGLT